MLLKYYSRCINEEHILKGKVMKNISIFLFAGLLLLACSETRSKHSNSGNQPTGSTPPAFSVPEKKLVATDVVFTLYDKIDMNRNAVWCKPMQLCWNEIVKQNGGPLKFSNPILLFDQLNKPAFPAEPGKFSYVFAGLATHENKKKVLAESKKLNLYYNNIKAMLAPMRPIDYFAYSNYWMRANFEHEFVDGTIYFKSNNKTVRVAGFDFGYSRKQTRKLAKQVKVHYHKNLDKNEATKVYNSEFVVELKSKKKDIRLILAQVKPRATLADNAKYIIELMNQNKEKYAGKAGRIAGRGDFFGVPNIEFKSKKMMQGFSNNILKSSNPVLNNQELKAMFMGIKFKLDKKGAEVKAEAMIKCKAESKIRNTRRFIFDRPFFVMVLPADKDDPDFVCWVANNEILELEKNNSGKYKKSVACRPARR